MSIIETTVGDSRFFISDQHHYLKNLVTDEVSKIIKIPISDTKFAVSELNES